MRPKVLAAAIGLSALCLASTAQAAPAAPGDPFEHANRVFFIIQGAFDTVLIGPAARLYHALTPGPIGRGLHNVVSNLGEPVVIINDVVQGRLKRAGTALLRFTANSTAGFLGLMDVATPGGLPHHDNDFGVTLGRLGVGPGPYLFVPLVGPSDARDLLGQVVDATVDPLHFLSYPHRTTISISVTVVDGLDTRASMGAELQGLLSGAADPYATLRSVYQQQRQGAVEGGAAIPALPPLDDPLAAPATPAPAVQPGSVAPADPAPAAPAPAASGSPSAAIAPLDSGLVGAAVQFEPSPASDFGDMAQGARSSGDEG